MIENLSLTNYKAFEKENLDIKPITILLGTNSSGKSSIIQFLLMLKQTINNVNDYESALKLNGKFVNLGEVENIFRNKNTNKNLRFSLQFNISQKNHFFTEFNFLKRSMENDIIDLHYRLTQLDERFNSITNQRHFFSTKNFKDIDTSNIFLVIKDVKRLKKKYLKEDLDIFFKNYKLSNKTFSKNIRFQKEEIKELLISKNINEIEDSYFFIDQVSNKISGEINIEYEIRRNKKNDLLEVVELCWKNSSQILLKFSIKYNKGHKKYILESDLIESKILEKYRVEFGKSIKFEKLSIIPSADTPINQLFRRKLYNKNYFCNNTFNIFSLLNRILSSNFSIDKINYISPLRAFPKRYYFLDESNISNSLDSIDGDSITETLKKHSSLISKVNLWFEKFGLSVGVEDVKEVIHRLKINQNGLSLDITDVGFGISQVLPIIVQGFLSKPDSLTIIEQPEIHLHPMMQSELADLFIDIVADKSQSKKLLIETHSESLLKRLRRRIAEGKINNNDVAIYFIQGSKKKTTSARIQKLEVSSRGSFDWPIEFYSTDLEDTTEFLKHQI
ncbi:AAA family ATPase [Chryseobacterium sp. ES2]|uniref:AAA family ATPase n=1 Tax=Chryseobacterium metallicongregator TaxID=3073042 RepID=A0ABU1DZ44_9FLAO|nr:AAA family ATPase [Chryseobacterium sp. ES2]MDR4950816.1 AAA family ATPase [Chryseobacterium sp. ES2]